MNELLQLNEILLAKLDIDVSIEDQCDKIMEEYNELLECIDLCSEETSKEAWDLLQSVYTLIVKLNFDKEEHQAAHIIKMQMYRNIGRV